MITLNDRDWIDIYLGASGSTRFDNLAAHLFCYQLARDTGELNGNLIRVQRFTTNPRYRIFSLDATPGDLIEEAGILDEISARPVSIINAEPCHAQSLLWLNPTGKVEISKEAVLVVDRVLDHLDECLEPRARSAVRKAMREMEWSLEPSEQEQREVVDQWKKLNAEKHFRLSITRDYVAIRSPFPEVRLLGKRDGFPSALHLIARHPANPEWGVQLVEKSLNYATVPGGKYGTSDANFVMLCQVLREKGIKYVNLGTWDGGNKGLGVHKLRFARECDCLETVVFTYG